MFDLLAEVGFVAVWWGVLLFLLVLPMIVVATVAVALALVFDAVVRPRVELARACDAAAGNPGPAWSDAESPRAWLANRPLPRGGSRYLVVPGALVTAALLVFHAPGLVSIPVAAVLLLLARAAHAADVASIEVARSAVRTLGLGCIVACVALFPLTLYMLLTPLVYAIAVYGAGRVRAAAGTAWSAGLLGAPLAIAMANLASVAAVAAPLAMFVGGVAWRVEIGRDARHLRALRAGAVRAGA